MRYNIQIINPVHRNMNRVYYLFLFLIFTLTSNAQNFDFSITLKSAYDEIIHLELEKGTKILESIKSNDPSNYLVYHIENYIDFFTCFINEELDEYNRLSPNKNIRIAKIKSGNSNSPYYLFSQAEIILQWSLVELKFKKYIPALTGMNKAIRLLEENEKLFPDFLANKKSLSALHAIVGTIPDTYKSMLSWISSFNGSIDQGYKEIQYVASKIDSTFPFKEEVWVTKALIELHLVNNKEAALSTIDNKNLDYTINPLINFISANITHKAGYNDKAILILEALKPSETQMPLYYLDYLHGIYKLNRLDPDSDQYIRRYLNYFEGQNYIKEAYQKLAWHAWAINQDSIEYKRNMEFCRKRGDDLIDEDKQALDLATKANIPNQVLLQARLLNDGGYEKEALALLQDAESNLRTEAQEIEYLYRRGKIAQGLKLESEAERFYLECLKYPFDNEVYYQTAASLYIGQLYEKQYDYVRATYYYNYSLKLDPDQYKSSLHQKAKAGKLRVGSFLE